MVGNCIGTVISYDQLEGRGSIDCQNIRVHYDSLCRIGHLLVGDKVRFDTDPHGRMNAINVSFVPGGYTLGYDCGELEGLLGGYGGGLLGGYGGGYGGGVGYGGGGDFIFHTPPQARLHVDSIIRDSSVPQAWRKEEKYCFILNCDASVHAERIYDAASKYRFTETSNGDYTIGSILRGHRGEFFQCYTFHSNGFDKLTSTDAEAEAVLLSLNHLIPNVSSLYFETFGQPLTLVVRTDCSAVIRWLGSDYHLPNSPSGNFVREILRLLHEDRTVTLNFEHEVRNANLAAHTMSQWGWDLDFACGVRYNRVDLERGTNDWLSEVQNVIDEDVRGVAR